MKSNTIKPKAPRKIEKNLDAVKLMREIRDKMSLDIKGMTLEEETAYINKLISSKKIQE